MEILRAEDLTFTYPNQSRAALEEISFSVDRRRIRHALRQKRKRKIHALAAVQAVCRAARHVFGKYLF